MMDIERFIAHRPRRRSRVRVICAATVFCVLTIACGGTEPTRTGSDGSASSGEAGAVENDRSIDAAVEALVADFGTEGAFAVGVFAMERGYQLQQIIDGALAGSAGRDGAIEGVAPAGQPLGVVEINPDSILFAAIQLPAEELLQVEVLREVAAQTVIDEDLVDVSATDLAGATILVLILGFLDQGWSPEDVIGAIIAGVHPADFNPADADEATAEERDPPASDDDDDDSSEATTVFLSGAGRLTTTDIGNAETCLAELDVRAMISLNGEVELTYTRTIAAGVPPGGLGSGDVDQYVECIPADRSERHEGTFDVGTGFVQLEDVGELQVEVSDDGLAFIQGTISATDFLNNWTLDVDLTECTGTC